MADYLTKAVDFSRRHFRDYAGWADVADNFTGYRNKLLSIGGSRVGADTGNLATEVQLGAAAHELLRKGIEVLLKVDLSCTPHPVNHGDWEYAFQVHKIDLKKLAEGPSDGRQGLSVDGVLETDSETARSQSDLYRAISTPIARLLGIPYVRFVESPSKTKFYGETRLEFESFLPGRALSETMTATKQPEPLGPDCATNKNAQRSYDVKLRATLLDRKAALETCSELDADRRLRSGRATRPHEDVPPQSADFDEVQTTMTTDCNDESAQPLRRELVLYPHKGGTYLVEVATEVQVVGEPEPRVIARDFRCVDVEEPEQYLWAQLGYQWGLHESVDKAETTTLLQAMGGISFTQTDFLSTGLVVGYGYAQHSGLTAPTWADGLGAPASLDGTTPYSWTRHSLLLGPSISLEGTFWCRPGHPCYTGPRRLQLVAILMPLLDAGIILPDARARELSTYVADPGGTAIFDPRVTMLLQLGASRRFDETHDLALLFDLQQSGGWLDFRRLAHLHPSEIGYDGEWTAGVSVQTRFGR